MVPGEGIFYAAAGLTADGWRGSRLQRMGRRSTLLLLTRTSLWSNFDYLDVLQSEHYNAEVADKEEKIPPCKSRNWSRE
jgi:hypothetical protein